MYDLSVAGIKYIYWILIFVCMEPFFNDLCQQNVYIYPHFTQRQLWILQGSSSGYNEYLYSSSQQRFPSGSGHGYSWKVIQLNLFSCLAKDPELKVNRTMKLVVLHPYSLNIKQTYIKGFFWGGTAHTLNPPSALENICSLRLSRCKSLFEHLTSLHRANCCLCEITEQAIKRALQKCSYPQGMSNFPCDWVTGALSENF